MTPERPADLPGGLHCLAPLRAEEISATLLQHGCDVRRIELGGATDKAMLLQRIAVALEFPDWFGNNWDALADCLCDLSWLPDTPQRALLFTGIDLANPAEQTLLDLLSDLADATPVQWLFVTPAAP